MPIVTAAINALTYPDRIDPALADIHLQFSPGEFIWLCGASNSGKSSFCQCLAGVIPHFLEARLLGSIVALDTKTTDLTLPQMASLVSLVTDDPQNQLFCAFLEEDIAFGPCNQKQPAKQVQDEIDRILDQVGLAGYNRRRPETLSGGETQRAVLASFLAMRAPVLILDRALDQVDPSARNKIYERLADICRRKQTLVIVVDEKTDSLPRLVSRAVFLEKGRLAYDGHPNDIPSDLAAKVIPPALTVDSRAADKPGSSTTEHVSLTPGLPPLVSIEPLSFAYPDCPEIINEINLDLFPGEFTTLLGENGTGKTTLARLLVGLLKPKSGRIKVKGLDTREHATATLSKYVGFMFQNPELQVCSNSVRQEIDFALRVRGLPANETEKRLDNLLTEFDLEDVADLHPYRLPRARLQKAALASALITEPELLILDEPASHMSYPRNWDALKLVQNKVTQGLSVLMITHDPVVALYFSERLLVMKNGRIALDIRKNEFVRHHPTLLGSAIG